MTNPFAANATAIPTNAQISIFLAEPTFSSLPPEVSQLKAAKSNITTAKAKRIAKTYLADYSDPLIEMNEALNNAIDKGLILLAKQNETILGVCIIINTQFDNFIPTFHIAYIGTSGMHKGRGIGTELIKRAVNITDGKLSLHVDLDNKGAKKLYEKMGFKHVYNRMIYYSE